MNLVQGDMVVAEYENNFMSFMSFAKGMQLYKVAKASQFQDNLNLSYKGLVKAQRLGTLCNVMDKDYITEQNSFEAKKAREAKYKLKFSEKTKNKNSNAVYGKKLKMVVIKRGESLMVQSHFRRSSL